MNDYQLIVAVVIAVAGPLVTLRYLKTILLEVIDLLCPAPGSSEFWWRVITVLALTGSLLLMLIAGVPSTETDWTAFVAHALALSAFSVFVSITIVASRIWRQIVNWVNAQATETLRHQTPQEKAAS